ncbi:MAG TPA: hypothetical protein VK543_01990 [Puia sp.]|nr:hypothetical protein [Puia sp.]
MVKSRYILLALMLLNRSFGYAQDVSALVRKLQDKLELINSYEADGVMKTNVSFLKVPDAAVKVYYKKPDKLKIKNENGISLVPKGTIAISLNGLLRGHFTALDAGFDVISGIRVKVVKLLPADESVDIVLSTIYVDEKNLLILKARTTTKENGTYEVEMQYGKYKAFALPDKVICSFNSKDYKLPKGITFDYDDGSKKKEPAPGDAKGKVEISYSTYLINKNIPDSVF